MSAGQRGAASATIRVGPALPSDEEGIEAAIRLGNQSRATLGHMPWAAYRDAAGKGTLLLAHADDAVVGYALYGLTRARVRLTHLCVAPD